mgnify:CR=1 FL=1
MIRSILWALLGLLWGVAYAQPTTFDTLYTQGHIGYAIMPNSEGYAIAGNHHNGDFWLFQVDEQGRIRWEQTYGRQYGLSDFSLMRDAKQGKDGSYFLAGWSFAIPDTNWGKNFGYVVKVDSLGNQLWDYLAYESYDSSRHSKFYNVTSTPDGGCLLSGNTITNPDVTVPSETRFWIVKLDSLGDVEFEKIYHNGSANSTYDDGTSEAVVLPNNQGYLIGTTYDFGRKGYLMRLDVNGDTLWTQKYDRMPQHGQGQWAITEDMVALPEGDYLMAMGIFLVRVDSMGNLTWRKPDILSKELTLLSDGNLVAHNGGWIYLISPDGQILWQRFYTDYNLDPVDFIRFVEIIPAQDEGLLILYNNLSGLGLMKTDCEGNLVNPVACAATSVAVPNAELVKVYPNPSSGSFIINLDPKYSYHLTITDMAGRTLLHQAPHHQSPYQWNAESYPAGVYMLRIENEITRKIQYLKMVKQSVE